MTARFPIAAPADSIPLAGAVRRVTGGGLPPIPSLPVAPPARSDCSRRVDESRPGPLAYGPGRDAPQPCVADDWRADLGYQASEVQDLAGVTYRQLTYWDETRLVSPSLSPAGGSGSRRRYSVRDVQFLVIARRLLDAGVSLQQVRVSVDKLREAYPDDRPLPRWWSADLAHGITITVADLDLALPGGES